VNSKDAKAGYEFLHMGPAEECRGCRLVKTCMENIIPGRRYRITGVKDMEHPCALHDKVKVVEVEEAQVLAALEKRKAFPGSKIEFSRQDCDDIFCPGYRYCRPEGLFEGDICKITGALEAAECRKGRSLVVVRLERVP
jgi:hypothetical protein